MSNILNYDSAKLLLVKSFWDDAMNDEKQLEGFPSSSKRHAYWKCSKGHSWRASICSLYIRTACPICHKEEGLDYYNLAKNYPDYAKEWHPRRNAPLTPEQVSPDDTLKVWWKCYKGHEWQGSIRYRIKNNIECKQCVAEKTILEEARKRREQSAVHVKVRGNTRGLADLDFFALCGEWSQNK